MRSSWLGRHIEITADLERVRVWCAGTLVAGPRGLKRDTITHLGTLDFVTAKDMVLCQCTQPRVASSTSSTVFPGSVRAGRRRLHGYLNDIPPAEFEATFYATERTDQPLVEIQ